MASNFDINTPPNDRHARRSKGIPTWVLVISILGLIGLCFVVFIVGIGVLFVYTAKEVAVTGADKAVVLEAHELAAWFGDFEPVANSEQFLKQRYIDRTHDIEYFYEDEENYLYNLMTVERRASDAIAGYAISTAATKLSFKSEDVELQKRDELYSWGDKSEFYLLKFDGEIYGMLFFGRQGARYAEILVSGFYSDDPDDLRELFDPPLNAFAEYEP